MGHSYFGHCEHEPDLRIDCVRLDGHDGPILTIGTATLWLTREQLQILRDVASMWLDVSVPLEELERRRKPRPCFKEDCVGIVEGGACLSCGSNQPAA